MFSTILRKCDEQVVDTNKNKVNLKELFGSELRKNDSN